jgi:hypothetical protein
LSHYAPWYTFFEFEFLDCDNVKPFKDKYSINLYLACKTCFLIWYLSALHVFDSMNHTSNPFKMQHMNEISKLNLLTYFQSTFSQHDKLANFAKYIERRFLKRLIQLFKLLKTSTYPNWCPQVVQKDKFLRRHLLSNLLVTNLCFLPRKDYVLGIL